MVLRRAARPQRRSASRSCSSSGRPTPTAPSTSGFAAELEAAGRRQGRPVYFLCRSGVRSVAAAEAATARRVGPVAQRRSTGFEGPHDDAAPPVGRRAGRSRDCRGCRDERRERRTGAPTPWPCEAGLSRSGFDETSEALFLTSGFVYDSAEEAEAAFKGEVDRFIYSRYGNPTVAMFEERLRQIEGAEACFATGSGMSAVFVALAALLGQGDRVVSLAGPLRLVLRHPRRDPAALGRRDRLRRRRRPRPVARGALRADHRRLLRDAEQPDAGARRHRAR